MDWDLLRVFDMVARTGTFTESARALGLSQSTVSRKMDALEAEAPTPLLVRETPLRLTERGRTLAAAVAGMAERMPAVEAALAETSAAAGEVTLATVSELLRWVLVTALPPLYQAHPGLRLRILADPRTVSLATGEADLAVRMARPERGELYARKLQGLQAHLYAARTLPLTPTTPWVGFCGSLEALPEHRALTRMFSDRPAALLVEDAEALGGAVAAGLGVGVLLEPTAARFEGLERIEPADVGGRSTALPHRQVWLVMHRSRRNLPAVRAVADWVAKALGQGVELTKRSNGSGQRGSL